MAGSEVAERDDYAPAPLSPEVAERIVTLCETIPEQDGNGAENIVVQLLDAVTIDDLNAPWDGTSGRNLNGQRVTIRGVTKRPSRFGDGSGIFLVADAADTKTGERRVFTTSALSVVVQLARCHQLDLFPVIAEIVVADRPTENGFYPYHLKILAATPKQADK